MSNKRFNPTIEHDIGIQYLSGSNSSQLSEKYNTNRTTICNILKRLQIIRRNVSDAARHIDLNQNAFDKLSEESAYWIGFLLADGCVIHKGGSKIISLGLANIDQVHVDKFRLFIGSKHSTRNSRITIYSTHLVNKLESYNIIPNKTSKETAPDILKFNRDFWRGVFDGDGSITHVKNKYPTASLCGSKDICVQFLAFAKQYIKTNTKVHLIKGKNCYHVLFHGNIARELINVLYKNSLVFLDRKMYLASAVNVVLYDKKAKE